MNLEPTQGRSTAPSGVRALEAVRETDLLREVRTWVLCSAVSRATGEPRTASTRRSLEPEQARKLQVHRACRHEVRRTASAVRTQCVRSGSRNCGWKRSICLVPAATVVEGSLEQETSAATDCSCAAAAPCFTCSGRVDTGPPSVAVCCLCAIQLSGCDLARLNTSSMRPLALPAASFQLRSARRAGPDSRCRLALMGLMPFCRV